MSVDDVCSPDEFNEESLLAFFLFLSFLFLEIPDASRSGEAASFALLSPSNLSVELSRLRVTDKCFAGDAVGDSVELSPLRSYASKRSLDDTLLSLLALELHERNSSQLLDMGGSPRGVLGGVSMPSR